MKTSIIPNLLGRIESVEIQEGETIETKVARITQNKEPITDSAPIIFTEKKDGVLPAYNIRPDIEAVRLHSFCLVYTAYF